MDLEIGVEEVKKISISELLDRLLYDLKGLSEEDAEARLKYGINEIFEGQQNHLKKFLGYFWGPSPWMIEFALIISLLIRHWPEFSIILLLLLINGLVGFFQEDRADNAIELLKEKLAYKARVLRGDKWANIPSKNIVPGDFVKVHLGDIVPADIKLIEGGYVTVDESSLTGESLPVDKTVNDIIYSGCCTASCSIGNTHSWCNGNGQKESYSKQAHSHRRVSWYGCVIFRQNRYFNKK
jgi:H+-transporting ATPase